MWVPHRLNNILVGVIIAFGPLTRDVGSNPTREIINVMERKLSPFAIDRINDVINTKSFIDSLNKIGIDLIEFQIEWPKYGVLFNDLPLIYQSVIDDGQREIDGWVWYS